MKKILLAAVAALAIVGCSQNEEIEKAGEKAEINFGAVVRNATRATIVNNADFKSFKVYGYKTADKIAENGQLGAFIPGLTVSKEGDTDNWSYTDDAYYWPLSGYVQFFSTVPERTLTVGSGYPSFSYNVGVIGDQKDLLAANLIDKQKDAGDLQLPFCHLLTQVNFSIKGDVGFTYTLTGLELIGVKDEGTFTFDGSATAGTWTEVKASTTPAEYVFTGSVELVSTSNDDSANLESANSALFMLLPQDILENTVKVKVTYSAKVTTKEGNGQSTLENGVKEVSIPAVKWEKGKRVRYTLNLTSDATEVTFGKPSWENWSDAGSQPDPVTPVTPPAE
ncbi:fimbrillin family protein [Bacteroides cellulosilyticus]|jgi:hypothetical protein|uniref:fimbrillin family protein n=1 Tax=Bacteroides cellulosilyticus TaxID=246787 RepID=UPI001899724E|nr:fimbrillin family protein [Bacteroides cellulosilyticus]